MTCRNAIASTNSKTQFYNNFRNQQAAVARQKANEFVTVSKLSCVFMDTLIGLCSHVEQVAQNFAYKAFAVVLWSFGARSACRSRWHRYRLGHPAVEILASCAVRLQVGPTPRIELGC